MINIVAFCDSAFSFPSPSLSEPHDKQAQSAQSAASAKVKAECRVESQKSGVSLPICLSPLTALRLSEASNVPFCF